MLHNLQIMNETELEKLRSKLCSRERTYAQIENKFARPLLRLQKHP